MSYTPAVRADFTKLPRHVAIIMDGNGRWAKAHKLAVALGHRQGVETLRDVISHTSDLGIESLTLYAFSTENWKRSPEEVGALMQLILEFFAQEIDKLHEKNVRIIILGDKDGFPDKQRDVLKLAESRTAANTGLKLNIALNYGGRQEIVAAAKKLAAKAAAGEIQPDEIDMDMFASELYTAGLPEVDFMIRTSGEIRLSNFLLYQLAYAEFYQTDVLWPDFDKKAYDEALLAYTKRNRRFGGV